MQVKNLKAIGFDIDGTLYFPQINEDLPNFFCQAIAKELKIPEKDVIDFYRANINQGSSSPQIIKDFCNQRLSPQRIEEIFLDLLEENEKIDAAQYSPQLIQFMNSLKQRYALFIVTGNRVGHAYKKLDALGLENSIFKEIRGSCEEKIEGLRQIAKLMNTPLREIMYVGDNETTDIWSASSLGMLTVKISREQDPGSLATYQIQNILGLRNII